METATIEPRMTNVAKLVPDAMKALIAFSGAAKSEDLPPVTRYLVHLRASQINGCSFCTQMHAGELKQAGESDERIWAVGAWRESVLFTGAERAALALTESVTRLSDRSDPVPDEVFDEAARHYDEPAMAALLIEIAAINAWNRLNVAVRQPAGVDGW